MVELYGPSFLAAYGDSPSPLWQTAIGKLRDEEIRKGFIELAQQPRDFPANLTQFVSACRPTANGSPRYLGVPTTPAELRKLEPPKDRMPRMQDVEDWLHLMRETIAKAEIKGNPKYPPSR
jgi:hypothetical protein